MPSYNPQPKLDFIDGAVTDMTGYAILLQKDVITKLNKFFTEFDITNGRFVDNDRATTILNDIEGEIRTLVDKSQYKSSVTKWFRNYDEIVKFNITAQKLVNGIEVTKKDLSKTQDAQIKLTTDQLIGQGVDVKFIQPMTQTLMNNIIMGATLKDTRNYLLNYVGTGEDGALARYASPISRDLLRSYDGRINQQIQKEYELNALMYVGSLVKDSREQCIRWVGMGEILLSELQFEIDWAYKNGSGMKKGTTVDTFCIDCGGWNCRHGAIPFRKK